jgi:hypothetical protein
LAEESANTPKKATFWWEVKKFRVENSKCRMSRGTENNQVGFGGKGGMAGVFGERRWEVLTGQ